MKIWDLKSSKPVASHSQCSDSCLALDMKNCYSDPLPMKDSPVTCLASEGTLILSGHVDGCIRLFSDSLKVWRFLLSNVMMFLKVLMVSNNQGPSSGLDDKDDESSVSIEAVAFVLRFVLDEHNCFIIVCPVTS